MFYKFTPIITLGLMLHFSIIAKAGIKDDDKKSKFNPFHEVEASYLVGAQLYNEAFIYDPGISLFMTHGAYTNKSFRFGAGTGIQMFEESRFIPVYAEVTAFTKKKSNSPLLNVQMGYSHGWSEDFSNLVEYEFKGGPFFSAGIGRRVPMGDKVSLIIKASYRHQFAKIKYEVFNTDNYMETVNYDMLSLSVCISMKHHEK